MTITRNLLAQIRELMSRGMIPKHIANSMAMSTSDVSALIIMVKQQDSICR